MKFKGSSIKSDTLYDFTRSLKSGIIPSLIVLIGLLFISTYESLHMIVSQKDGYAMFFIREYADITLAALMLGAGVFAGLFAFRFLGSRQHVNVFLSLGLTRKTLFKNRCLAFFSEMLFAVIIPFTITLAINVRAYGVSLYMLKVYLFYIISSFSIILVGFSIGTLSMVISGTKTESVLTSFALSILPNGIVLFVFSCFTFFLKGYKFPFDSGFSLFPAFDFFQFRGLNTAFLRYLNPLMLTSYEYYFTGNVGKYSMVSGQYRTAESYWYSTDFNLAFSEFFPFVFWAFVGVSILILSAHLLVKRKAEITGLFNSSKLTAIIISVSAVLYASGCGLALGIFDARVHMNSTTCSFFMMGGYEKLTVLAQMLLWGLLSFMVCMFVYSLNFKRFISRLKFSLLVLLILIVPVICITGGFGFSSRLPNADEIKKIDLDYPFAPNNQVFDSVIDSDEIHPIRWSNFQSEKDKQLVLSLHQLLIESEGKPDFSFIQIDYTLVNGKKICRYYSEPSKESLLEALKLFDSDKVEEHFTNRLSDKDSWLSGEEAIKRLKENSSIDPIEVMVDFPLYSFEKLSGVSLKAAESSEAIDIFARLDNEKYDRLLQAIAIDYCQMTSNDYYFPEDVCKYTLIVTTDITHAAPYKLYIYSSMKNTLSFFNTLNIGNTQSSNKITSIAVYECTVDQFYRQSPNNFEEGKAHTFIAAMEDKKTVRPYCVYANANDIASFAGALHSSYMTIGKNVSYALVTYSNTSEAVYIVKR